MQNKNSHKKKQGFKGNCQIYRSYRQKAADCWGNKNNNKNKNPNPNRKDWHFKGKFNYCGMYGHEERDCRKKKAQENEENKDSNVAKEVEEEETVLMTLNENQFNDQVCRALVLDGHENMVMICMEIQDTDCGPRTS